MKVKAPIHYVSLIKVIKSRLSTSENVQIPENVIKKNHFRYQTDSFHSN